VQQSQQQQPESTEQVLEDAIARNAAIVLSLPSAGMLRHQKSRFLGPGSHGFWVECAAGEDVLVDSLIESQQPVGVSFKSGVYKVVFASPIMARQAEYTLSDTIVVPALLIMTPTQLKMSQRRTSYRVAVPPEGGVSARIWRIGEKADLKAKPMAAAELGVKLLDLSTGGMGVLLAGKAGEPPKVTPEDRLRIDIWSERGTLTLEGHLRHRPNTKATDPTVRAGIQFKKLENDIDGRKSMALLQKIIGELQRLESRRVKLGLKIA
jgi:c-di-GMP-binding flagellar brake protein YcgR